MRCPDGANNIQSSQYQIKHGLLWDPKSSHPLGENHTESPWRPKTLPNTPLGYVTQISCILTCFGFIQALLEAKIGRFCLILDPQMVQFLYILTLIIIMLNQNYHLVYFSIKWSAQDTKTWIYPSNGAMEMSKLLLQEKTFHQ